MKSKLIYPELNNCSVAVIGLGYVGLPLAIEFAKQQTCNITGKLLNRKLIGFDIDIQRINELKSGFDRTNEVDKKVLLNSKFHALTNDIKIASQADVFIITVPTPIDEFKKPDLEPLKKASKLVASALKIRAKSKKNSIPIVVYESTVYPGTTEEICIPILEKESGLLCENSSKTNIFGCGYSPERINPGDKEHRLPDIIKVTSGSNKKVSKWIDSFYGSIIKAGTYSTNDIKTAEAAKIIENTQRDINIALMNELAIIFKLLKIDTLDVLKAASTKWNFLKFKPGLVGGHCIGVDPYYLTYKAESIGYSPEMVLAGRRINDDMSRWVSEQIVIEMAKRKITLENAKVLILGFTFKENCPDIRNTKIFELVRILKDFKMDVEIIDPLADSKEVKKIYGINIFKNISTDKKYNVLICALAHSIFTEMKMDEWVRILEKNSFIFDLKGIAPRELKPIRI
tara:strand:+ start:127 stop:1497 length:1371 start_codon:yes stop_codon:yes gene_type:complete